MRTPELVQPRKEDLKAKMAPYRPVEPPVIHVADHVADMENGYQALVRICTGFKTRPTVLALNVFSLDASCWTPLDRGARIKCQRATGDLLVGLLTRGPDLK